MGHDHDRLDQLVDTDPIELRDQAYALLSRAEQAEATIERVRAAIEVAHTRDHQYLLKRDRAQRHFRTQWDNRAYEIRRLANEITAALDPPEETT